VTIKGADLAGVIRVKFGGTIAAVVSDTATRIKANVPAGSTTGYIKVRTPGGAATSASEFVVLASSTTTTTPASSSIAIGNGNSDSAVVSGDATYGSPTGTVTFYECGSTASPEPCTSQANQVGSPVSVTTGANDTSSAASVSFTPSSSGYWCFAGYYSGDSNYAVSSDTTTDECFDVAGPSISNVVISGNVNSPTVSISGSGFGTIANLGSGEAACGSSPTGLDYANHFLFADTTDGWNAGEGSPTYDCIGVIIQSYSNDEVVFTFGSQYGVYRLSSGVALLSSGDQFTMTLLEASFSGTTEYTTDASNSKVEIGDSGDAAQSQ
jgi:hypothetical protein